MNNEIQSGKFQSHLMQPINTLQFYYATMIGRRVVKNSIQFFGYSIALVLSVIFLAPVIIDFSRVWILIFFMPITFTINQFFGNIIGTFLLFLKDKRDFDGVDDFWVNLKDVLAGFLIPLYLLPFSEFIINSPFGYIIHHPMQIYLGKYSTTEIIYTFLRGIAWCVVLWLLARIIFKLGLKRNEAVGL